MTEEAIGTYFNDVFIVEEDYELSEQILERARIPGNYTIVAGIYQFQRMNEKLVVRF